ncbi:DUF4236 domain-containing protein [Ectopseudomonas chengduensis]|nr:DUF4236 domain-containing protein [Pseudomonas sp. WS 5019]NMY14997.1 DUF4236 domain-containing protein [Pseudomonas sp. WS 5019]
MALRIRRSFKVAPGIRLNVSKSGLSTSVGGKGLTGNLSKRGVKVTAGIPGIGISTSKLYGSKGKQRREPEPAAAETRAAEYVIAVLVVIALLVWIF